MKTPLGWTIYRPTGKLGEDRAKVNFTRTEHDILNSQLERRYKDEFSDTNRDVEEGMSVEDRKAEEIMDKQ